MSEPSLLIFPCNSTTKWESFRQKNPVNFTTYSEFWCCNKPLQTLDTSESIKKQRKNENNYHQITVANGYYKKSDIPNALKS